MRESLEYKQETPHPASSVSHLLPWEKVVKHLLRRPAGCPSAAIPRQSARQHPPDNSPLPRSLCDNRSTAILAVIDTGRMPVLRLAQAALQLRLTGCHTHSRGERVPALCRRVRGYLGPW